MSKMKNLKPTKLYYFDFIGTFGGAQQSTAALLNKINAGYQNILEPSFIAVNGTNCQFIENLTIPIHRLKMGNKLDIFKVGRKHVQAILYFIVCAIKLRALIKKENSKDTNIIFLCNSSKALYTLFFLKLLALDFEIVFYSRGWGKQNTYNVLTKYILNNLVSKILCVSHETKKNMSAFIKNNKKIFVTYTSVNLEKLDKFYSEKTIDTNCLKILFAGALIPTKGLKELIEGIQQLPVEYQEKIELFIAGINNTPEVLHYVNECKVICSKSLNKTHWLGWRDDIPKIISEVDIVCLPSYSEGLPRIIQESMYMGRLAICTPVGGVPSLIEDEVTGYLIEVGSSKSITLCLQKCFDSSSLKEIQARARQHIYKNFNLDNQVKLVVDSIVYENEKK